ncbi:hypothetical protein H6P81_017069 [Aristolochia fimbriata]|uniref:Ribonuclease H n=1 Tax=Aristolochia fimbriata TaxID=158543 RepID=A0AAV7DX24_ARIFI|nr:hypothetical protein H6P81_017069 [Aristolochia fimbriata]
MGRKKKNYYAVLRGLKPGVYGSWAECCRQVTGFPGSVFKGFGTIAEAEKYLSSVEIDDDPDHGEKERCVFGNGSGEQSVQHGNYVSPVGRADGIGSNTEEITEHVDHFQRFTSLYELGSLLQRTQSSLDSSNEENGRAFLFDGDQLSDGDYFKHDAAKDLLIFKSEEHLFAYLGLRTIKSKQEAGTSTNFRRTYVLELIGSSRGDPGKAGAGIILKTPDNFMVCKLLVSFGIIPWRLASLHALIVALELSLERGIHHLQVIGKFDAFTTSATHDQRFSDLAEVAHDLMKRFKYLLVSHVGRVYEAELVQWVDGAADLPDGCRKMDCEIH